MLAIKGQLIWSNKIFVRRLKLRDLRILQVMLRPMRFDHLVSAYISIFRIIGLNLKKKRKRSAVVLPLFLQYTSVTLHVCNFCAIIEATLIALIDPSEVLFSLL